MRCLWSRRPGLRSRARGVCRELRRRGELGGACCAYLGGEKVVDLWGGIRNKRPASPGNEDTMVIVYSATKGLAAMTLALAHSRGWLDYEERGLPPTGRSSRSTASTRITVRQLLAHQAGLFAFDEPLDRERRRAISTALPSCWPARSPHGSREHGRRITRITLGFYEGELLRRIDPQHRSLGQFFQDEIATPLGTGRLHQAA